jgi:hypothetical protein
MEVHPHALILETEMDVEGVGQLHVLNHISEHLINNSSCFEYLISSVKVRLWFIFRSVDSNNKLRKFNAEIN